MITHMLRRGINMKNIILASGSPRRRELLALAGYEFSVVTSGIEEKITEKIPEKVAVSLANQKAWDVFNIILEKYGNNHIKDYIVIGADTVVSLGGTIFGKPKDQEDARRMIELLQGKSHYVYTGVSIVYMGNLGVEKIEFCESTRVDVVSMSDEEIEDYINFKMYEQRQGMPEDKPLYDWSDKAGGYGIQGTFAKYISGISGDYYNVMGLPVSHLHKELKKLVR